MGRGTFYTCYRLKGLGLAHPNLLKSRYRKKVIVLRFAGVRLNLMKFFYHPPHNWL